VIGLDGFFATIAFVGLSARALAGVATAAFAVFFARVLADVAEVLVAVLLGLGML
jgi:hypothetical protein